MHESIGTTDSPRPGVGKKARTLAIGALATVALSLPAVSAVSIAGHDAGRGRIVMPFSHRLATGDLKPASLRLT